MNGISSVTWPTIMQLLSRLSPVPHPVYQVAREVGVRPEGVVAGAVALARPDELEEQVRLRVGERPERVGAVDAVVGLLCRRVVDVLAGLEVELVDLDVLG
jgi:hypothetical protein